MELTNAVRALSALAQETRLKVFRLLLEHGPEGAPATEIADALGVRQNLMSSHLTVLANAGLTRTRRDGRRVYHAVDFDAARDLIGYLVKDCCNGAPERCDPLLEAILPMAACGAEAEAVE
ncbi:MAG: ArsR/SmtB family transcription factor [Parvularculaceae bacterium]